MASTGTSSEYGLILVGNSGVGKSYLANLLANENCFANECSARSVTHQTESIVCRLSNRSYRIYNIPGLIEGDQTRSKMNREEIQQAFNQEKHHSIVIVYVFGHQNGRIRREDVNTFEIMKKSYKFSSDSLLIIVNGLPVNRPKNYNEETTQALSDFLGMKPRHLCFIDQLNSAEIEKKRNVRQHLVDCLVRISPRIHLQTNRIDLIDDQVDDLRKHLDRLRFQWDEEQIEYQEIREQMEQLSLANERLTVLRRLFCHAKVDLRQLVALSREEEHLYFLVEQWNSEQIGHQDDSTSEHYRLSTKNRDNSQRQLDENLSKQHWLSISLNQHRKDLEQIAYELKQIFHYQFTREHDACREYFILLDDLRFDSSIENVQHSFLNDLILFTQNNLDDQFDSEIYP